MKQRGGGDGGTSSLVEKEGCMSCCCCNELTGLSAATKGRGVRGVHLLSGDFLDDHEVVFGVRQFVLQNAHLGPFVCQRLSQTLSQRP